jgi:superfamily II DNA or RNA helicase
MNTNIAPGTRLVIRDAEWIVKRTDLTSTDSLALTCIGLSEIVKDKEAIFLTDSELDTCTIIDPADTRLVNDESPSYRNSMLYIESLLRQTPPTDENLYIGHTAAMDVLPFQLQPANQALKQPRARLLIADAVGLGKTIEAGVLLSELIKRGRGKRILVLAVKSMLTQFQKELWARFTIPLTRLDSAKINRIKSEIPTNHNPFYYYDKTIISIDTLKQNTEYSVYLENAYWDIIVIDEAHNVAERGTNSQRSKLAKLLASRSDSLIMLSATPHDGKKESFASLMNKLNPTAIADPANYGPEDIKGLFIRRFKKDIADQVSSSFPEREMLEKHFPACAVEEEAFDYLTNISFTKLDTQRGGSRLFKTTLEKAQFSSPAACLKTTENRIKTLQKKEDPLYQNDITQLKEFASLLQNITHDRFSKYQQLLDFLKGKEAGFQWDSKKTDDRLVIFTERIDTLMFLQENLLKDLTVRENQVAILKGDMSDIDQQDVVESFGRDQSPIRLLLASDVASEGINLHYLSHKMIHFDIPWSLMVFQQRNGRIDRYGQEKKPQIIYLLTDSINEKIKGDRRILELLIKKEDQAVKNIGDPAALMKVYNIADEEAITSNAIEQGISVELFDKELEITEENDLLATWFNDSEKTIDAGNENIIGKLDTLFANDYSYLKQAVEFLKQKMPIQADFDDNKQMLRFVVPKDLQHRLNYLPREIQPESGEFILSADRKVIQEEIKQARKEESLWPKIQLLWEQHPILDWVNDRVLTSFGRLEAPIITLPSVLKESEQIFLVYGLIPNKKGQPLIHHWMGIRFTDNKFQDVMTFKELITQTEIDTRKYPNATSNPQDFSTLLPETITKAREEMNRIWKQFEDQINEKLHTEYTALEQLKAKHYQQLEFKFAAMSSDNRDSKKRGIDKIFDEFFDWLDTSMTTENNPYIRVVALFSGAK